MLLEINLLFVSISLDNSVDKYFLLSSANTVTTLSSISYANKTLPIKLAPD